MIVSQEPAREPFFTLVAVDWFKSDIRMDRLARRPGGLVNRTLKGGPPFVFVINMQVRTLTLPLSRSGICSDGPFFRSHRTDFWNKKLCKEGNPSFSWPMRPLFQTGAM
jgi:hypothetical protein